MDTQLSHTAANTTHNPQSSWSAPIPQISNIFGKTCQWISNAFKPSISMADRRAAFTCDYTDGSEGPARNQLSIVSEQLKIAQLILNLQSQELTKKHEIRSLDTRLFAQKHNLCEQKLSDAAIENITQQIELLKQELEQLKQDIQSLKTRAAKLNELTSRGQKFFEFFQELAGRHGYTCPPLHQFGSCAEVNKIQFRQTEDSPSDRLAGAFAGYNPTTDDYTVDISRFWTMDPEKSFTFSGLDANGNKAQVTIHGKQVTPSDKALEFIMAHELAHVLCAHQKKCDSMMPPIKLASYAALPSTITGLLYWGIGSNALQWGPLALLLGSTALINHFVAYPILKTIGKVSLHRPTEVEADLKAAEMVGVEGGIECMEWADKFLSDPENKPLLDLFRTTMTPFDPLRCFDRVLKTPKEQSFLDKLIIWITEEHAHPTVRAQYLRKFAQQQADKEHQD